MADKEVSLGNAQRKIHINYLFNLLYQIVSLVIPIILMPYISRVLGSDGIGKYNFALSYSSIFVLIASLGTALYGQRQIAICNEKKDRSVVFFEINIIRGLSFFILLFIYIFSIKLPEINQYSRLLQINILIILSGFFDITWFYLALEEVKVTVFRSLIVRIICTVLIILLVNSKDDVYLYALLQAFSNFVGYLCLWIPLRKRITVVGFHELKPLKHVSGVLMLFIPVVASQLYPLIDKIMITFITNNDSLNGMYSQADSIIKIGISLFVTSLTSVSIARVCKYDSVNNNNANAIIFGNAKIMYLGCFLLIGGIITCANPFVILFFGPGYDIVPDLLRLLCPVLIIIGLTNILGQLYFVPKGQYNVLSICVIITMGTNIVLNYLLISSMSVYGAAVASVLSECILLFLYYLLLRHKLDFLILIKSMRPYLIACLLGVAMCLPFRTIPFSNLGCMVFTGSVYVFIYTLLLILQKEENVMNAFRRMKERLF